MLRSSFAVSVVKKFLTQSDMNRQISRCAVLELLGSAPVDGRAACVAIQPMINQIMDMIAPGVVDGGQDGFSGIRIVIWSIGQDGLK
jgi:hypothetical protein